MRPVLLAVITCLAASISADAEPRASSSDDITRALGGDHWKPKAERSPTPPTPADAAKQAAPTQQNAEPTSVNQSATEIPIYDVEGRCQQFQKGSAGMCIDAEQRDYDLARMLWSGLSSEQQAKCASYAQQPGPRRYAAVQGCAVLYTDMNDIQRRQATTKFRY